MRLFHPKPGKPSHLIALAALIVLIGLLALVYGAARDAVPGLPDPPEPASPDRTDISDPEGCAAAGGVWNPCGPACPGAEPGAPCIQLCVPRCQGLGGEGAVSVFFPEKSVQAQSLTCENVTAVKRVVARSVGGYPEAALTELLKGPAAEEKAAGYFTSLPEGVRLRSLKFDGPVAYADFSGELSRVAGSCRVQSIRAQIEETLRQFASVKEVVISVEGNVEEALQP